MGLGITEYIIGVLCAAVVTLWHRTLLLTKQHHDCEARFSETAIKLAKMEAQLEAVRVNQYGTEVGEGAWFVADLHGKILDAGGRTLALTGCRATELVGDSVDTLISDPGLRAWHRSLLTGREQDLDVRGGAVVGKLRRFDGLPPVEVIVRLQKTQHRMIPAIRAWVFEVPELE